jgi:hypothetical protein
MRTKHVALLATLLMVGAVVGVSSAALALSTSKATESTKESVTGTLRVYYDTRDRAACGDGSELRITRVTVKYSRVNGAHREIKPVHLDSWEGSRDCDNNPVDVRRSSDLDPVFGCNGRCGANVTEEMGFSVSWPWVFVPAGTGCEVCFGGAAAHTHITNLLGDPVTVMCQRLGLPNPGTPKLIAPQCR